MPEPTVTEPTARHTPGPWLADRQQKETTIEGFTVVRTAHDLPLAYVASADDAQLMAAAPDLLAACKDALGTITHEPAMQPVVGMWPVAQTIQGLRAAIAKAEVRS